VEQDGGTEQQAETAAAAAAAGLEAPADAESFFAAEAADAFVDRPVSFAARGRSLSLRQNELGRRSMPLPPLARNRSMGYCCCCCCCCCRVPTAGCLSWEPATTNPSLNGLRETIRGRINCRMTWQ
jgi:hypothetical protein